MDSCLGSDVLNYAYVILVCSTANVSTCMCVYCNPDTYIQGQQGTSTRVVHVCTVYTVDSPICDHTGIGHWLWHSSLLALTLVARNETTKCECLIYKSKAGTNELQPKQKDDSPKTSKCTPGKLCRPLRAAATNSYLFGNRLLSLQVPGIPATSRMADQQHSGNAKASEGAAGKTNAVPAPPVCRAFLSRLFLVLF